MPPNQELWQVEAEGRIFDTTFDEMIVWIREGSLLPQDKVRKGNLRWIEASKVPSLNSVFNTAASGTDLPPPVVTVSAPFQASEAISSPVELPLAATTATFQAAADDVGSCSIHPGLEPKYSCPSCSSLFCKACPKSFGGSVKICPNCGALCDPIGAPEPVTYRPVSHPASGGSFGFGDFVEAFAYPFRFKTSLFFGAVMFAIFSLGQSIVGFGGIFMLSAAITCAMLANTLTFGILANTVENMAQGKLGLNFMPSFEDFSLWDDVIQPFFLMVGVYISSFGPLAALFLVAFFFVASSVGPGAKQMNPAQTDAARMVDPELPYAANAAQQSQQVRELLKKTADEQAKRVASLDDREIQPDVTMPQPAVKDPADLDFERTNQMIQEQRKAQLESAVGKTPETVASERAAMLKQVLGYGFVFLLLGGLATFWALFYYPAASAVAGYTRSFGAVINPLVGLDTIRRLGFDYVKILLMVVFLLVIAIAAGVVLSIVFVAFNMPGVGNVPAKFVGSFFTFYLSIVFAFVLGSALYKAADRLELPGA